MMQRSLGALPQDRRVNRISQSIALEEPSLPRLMHFSILLIGSLIALFVVWANFSIVEEVTVATGEVAPSGYIQDIQHPDGGVVREILIQDGDLVKAGQQLMRLDATNANADLGQMRARQTALSLQAARLRSYTGNHTAQQLPPEEQAILSSMEDARANQRNVVLDQILQKEKELAGLTASRAALQKNVALKQKEYSIYKSTQERGSSSQLMVLTSEQELNQLQGQLADTVSQENRARAAISEARNRLQSVDSDLKQDAMKTLGQVEAELAEINKSIARQEGAAERTTLAAPVNGVVKGLAVHTLGAVIAPGNVVMQIVPVDDEMIVEAMVPPGDIGNIKPGEKAKVKVATFDSSRFGHIDGKVTKISASTFQDEDGNSFYKARIKLDRNYVGNDPRKNKVMPGMTVQADIITGERTILEYLLKPIKNAADSAFHER